MNSNPLERALNRRGYSITGYHLRVKPLSRNDLITLLK